MFDISLKNSEFAIIKKIVFNEIGITLNDSKKDMVQTRLFKRLNYYQIKDFSHYLKIVQLSQFEKSQFLNQISTNETYFFRESAHFDFLEQLAKESKNMRVWSAAASFGAEAYSISMVLDSNLFNWEVIGTDINTHVLDIANKGLYQVALLEKIPKKYQEKYCLIGRNQYEGKMLVDRKLQFQTSFLENNLMIKNDELGKFDVVFLRNVLIYFTEETKIKVIKNILHNLKKGGYLIVGMTDYFHIEEFKSLKYIKDSIYKKV